jgi:translation initiation factor 2 subunit 1
MARVSSLTKIDLEELYEMFCWDLYKRFNHAYDAFNRIVNGDTSILDQYNLTPEIRDALVSVITHRLTPRPTSIRATIEATCFGYEGIDGIKEALKAGLACGTEAIPLKIRLLAPPEYAITTIAASQAEGLKVVENAIEKIREVLISKEGQLTVVEAPQVVSDKDDIQSRIAKLNKQKEDAENDDEDEDDDEDDE